MNPHFYRARLLLGLLHGERALAGPSYVNIDLTGRCNLACVGCPFHGPWAFLRPPKGLTQADDLPLDLYRGLLVDLQALGTPRIHLQGSGEPLLHPEVVRMTAEAKDKSFSVMLLTNGTLLDKDMCRALLAAAPDIIRVSFWATTPEEFQSNAPGNAKDNFNLALDGLKILAEMRSAAPDSGTVVAARLVVNRSNWTSLGSAVELFSDAGATLLELHPMHPPALDVMSGNDSLLTPEIIKDILSQAPDLRQRFDLRGMQHNLEWFLTRLKMDAPLWQYSPCFVGWFHARIGYQGDVRPCCMCSDSVGVIGNIHQESFYNIWNGEALRAFRRRTGTRKGLASMRDECNCSFCSSGPASRRIHRISRWLCPGSWK